LSIISPQTRDLARQLKALESGGNASSKDTPSFLTIEKLRPHLSMLMGQGGFHALLARALVLAAAEAPWLTAVRVVAYGDLEVLTVARATIDASSFSEGEVALLAQLLGLLVAFIGMALTVRLINQLWPQLSFIDGDGSNTANEEEAK